MPCSLAYTTTDRVRSVIGVDRHDITDEMMAGLDVGNELLMDLSLFAPDHAALYEAGNAPGASVESRDLTIAISAYCKYWGAWFLLKYMRLALPQLIRDGKNEMRRYEKLDLEQMAQDMAERADKFKDLIIEGIGNVESTAYPPIMGSAPPAYDPVSNA